MHNSNNNNHIVKSIDVSVSQAGREGDEMELIDSDGWRGASQRGNQYVSSTGERRP